MTASHYKKIKKDAAKVVSDGFHNVFD